MCLAVCVSSSRSERSPKDEVKLRRLDGTHSYCSDAARAVDNPLLLSGVRMLRTPLAHYPLALKHSYRPGELVVCELRSYGSDRGK